jgi:hypothetical protein
VCQNILCYSGSPDRGITWFAGLKSSKHANSGIVKLFVENITLKLNWKNNFPPPHPVTCEVNFSILL